MQPASASQQHVSDYFETTAAYWQTLYADERLEPTIYQDRHNTALGWIQGLGLRPSARILEVGCGAGLITAALARNGYTVDALDSTMAMLRMARNDAVHRCVQHRIRMYSADVHALPFQAATFDVVIAIGVIPWLHSERLALEQIRRVLKPGGYLLVTADNNARLNRLVDPLSSPVLAPLRLSAKHLLRLCRLWSPASGFQPKRHYPHEFNRLIDDCGFEQVKCRTVGFGPFTFLGKEFLTDAIGIRLHRWLQTVASTRGLFPLCWTGTHHLVLATRRN